jgi:hypothetical protein
VRVDDSSGWNDVLLAVWNDHVRGQVVARIEGATVGRRGWLVRALADADGCQPAWTETVHALVLAAIRDETGADLEELGSQAAWDCYAQVWDALADRWSDGGSLAIVPLRLEPAVVALLAALPLEAAAYAGADVTGPTPDPLWIGGRLRVDIDGLRAYLALDGGRAPRAVHTDILALIGHLESG